MKSNLLGDTMKSNLRGQLEPHKSGSHNSTAHDKEAAWDWEGDEVEWKGFVRVPPGLGQSIESWPIKGKPGDAISTIKRVYLKGGEINQRVLREARKMFNSFLGDKDLAKQTGQTQKDFDAHIREILRHLDLALGASKPPRKSSLRGQLVRLAHANPELRPVLLPLIKRGTTASPPGGKDT